MAKPSNPNAANQYQMDPRQKLCWESYVDPRSPTFGNATQSAIKAGYEPDYADQITTIEWFKGRLRRLNMLGKAEKVLDETLELNTLDEAGKVDRGLHGLKLDAAKFVAETQGKSEGYSKRQEVTGENGAALTAINVTIYGKHDNLSAQLATGATPIADSTESGQVQDHRLASQSTQNDLSDQRAITLGGNSPGDVLVCGSLPEPSQEDSVGRPDDVAEVLPAGDLG